MKWDVRYRPSQWLTRSPWFGIQLPETDNAETKTINSMLDKETCEERLHRTRLPIIDKAAKDIRLESTWMVIIYSQGGRVYNIVSVFLFCFSKQWFYPGCTIPKQDNHLTKRGKIYSLPDLISSPFWCMFFHGRIVLGPSESVNGQKLKVFP